MPLTLTEQMNLALSRNRVRGHFEPCPLDQPCENCYCPLRGHFQPGRGYATACLNCPCLYWSCRHGGVICPPGEVFTGTGRFSA